MKIEAQQPIFAPVTITLESEGELRFFFDSLGATSNLIDASYNLPSETLFKVWQEVKQAMMDRGMTTAYVNEFRIETIGEM